MHTVLILRDMSYAEYGQFGDAPWYERRIVDFSRLVWC
jgi:hypothetical protein